MVLSFLFRRTLLLRRLTLNFLRALENHFVTMRGGVIETVACSSCEDKLPTISPQCVDSLIKRTIWKALDPVLPLNGSIDFFIRFVDACDKSLHSVVKSSRHFEGVPTQES